MDQYGTEPLPELETDRSTSDTTVLTTGSSTYDSAVTREQCSNGECPNDDPSPMEAVWTELMSPVAVPGQTIALAPAPGTTQPDLNRFGEIRDALRPPGIDDHAVQVIRKIWTSVAEEGLSPMAAGLKSALGTLATYWEGDDFDRFAEEVEQVHGNLYDTVDEIDTATSELKTFEDQVYAVQGAGGEIPFPAARFWKADSGIVDGPKINVRPVWSAGGDCDKDRDEGDNWEALGLPRASGDGLRALVDERAVYYTDRGMDPTSARQQAEADYEAAQMPVVSHWSNTMRLAAETHNLGIADLRDQVVTAQEEPVLDAGARPLPESSAEDVIEPLPELEPGPVPQPPPLDGLDRFNPPEQQGLPEFPSPREDWSAADYGSTGAFDTAASDSGRFSSGSDPWGSSSEDEPSGGLASGGLGGASGGFGGMGSPSGAGSSAAGAGGIGGAFGVPAGAAGAGRGAAGARPGSAGAPGGRGAGSDEDEQERDTWLTEDQDVWGIVDADDDPYA